MTAADTTGRHGRSTAPRRLRAIDTSSGRRLAIFFVCSLLVVLVRAALGGVDLLTIWVLAPAPLMLLQMRRGVEVDLERRTIVLRQILRARELDLDRTHGEVAGLDRAKFGFLELHTAGKRRRTFLQLRRSEVHLVPVGIELRGVAADLRRDDTEA